MADYRFWLVNDKEVAKPLKVIHCVIETFTSNVKRLGITSSAILLMNETFTRVPNIDNLRVEQADLWSRRKIA